MNKYRLLLSTMALLVLALVLGGCFGVKVGQVNGTVEYENGSPVAGATVMLGTLSGTTDGNGAFSFKNVKIGPYVLNVFVDGDVVHSQNVTVDAKPTTVQVVLPDVVLYGVVTGSVADEDGEAVVGATVAVDALAIESVTDANGNYTLSNLPYGTYNLVVRVEGDTVYSADVALAQDSVVHDITVRSQVSYVAVGGYVTRDDASPVIGATVRIAGVSAETDAEGRFTMEKVLIGSHTLYVSIKGTDVHTETVTVEADASFDVVAKIGNVSGRVSKDNASPLEGATVSLDGFSTETDAQGDFEFVDIPYGFYMLTVRFDGQEVYSENLTVEGPTISRDVTVRIPPLPITLDPSLSEHASLLEPMFGTPWTTRDDPAGENVFYMGSQTATIPADTFTNIRYVLFTYEELKTPVLSLESRGGAEGSGNPSHYLIFGWEDYKNYYYVYVAESAATGISRVVNGVSQTLYRHGSVIWTRDRDRYQGITVELRIVDGEHVLDTYVNDALAMSYTFKPGEEPPSGRVGIGMWNLTHSAYLKNITLAEE